MDRFANHIHGDKFVDICQYAIKENDSPIDIAQFNESLRLAFCKTDQIPKLFNLLQSHRHKFVLVSHNSDHNITDEVYKHKPMCVEHWFAQNTLVDATNITPIPIGMERPGIAGSGDISVLKAAYQDNANRPYLAYLNISVNTNPNERNKVVASLANKHWVKYETRRLPFAQYIADLAKSRFTIAPPGNGHDTHRLWEALYMGSIPITIASATNRHLAMIYPMLLVDSWDDLTDNMLSSVPATKESLDISLGFDYWKNIILDKVRTLFV